MVLLLAACSSKSPSDAPPAPPAPAPVRTPDAGTRTTGFDFIADAKLVYRLVACAGDTPVPPPLQTVVDQHCADLKPYVDKYRTKYLTDARAWFVAKEPKDLP